VLCDKPKQGAKTFDFVCFPTKVCIQLSDPSSGIAGIELLRILIDEEGLSFTQAWMLVTASLNYTMTSFTRASLKSLNKSNEVKMQISDFWDFDIVKRVLPRHAELILILQQFLHRQISSTSDNHVDCAQRLSRVGLIINRKEGDQIATYVKMANLCFLCSHKVSGVS
jgi:starch phosphorylase